MADFATKSERHTPRRRNKDTRKAAELAAEGDLESAKGRAADAPWRRADPEWVDEIRYLFEAMQMDVMAQFMTPMSWATLHLKCSAWNQEFQEKFLGIAQDGTILYGRAPVPAAVLADMQKTLDSFGASEKARRDMKILIDPDPDGAAASAAGDAKMAARKAIARPARKALGQ